MPSMEEAIMLHQALQGGPTGPGTGIIAPSQQQTVPSMNMLGINQQGRGFNQRFGQGIVGSPTTMFNQQQQPNSMAFDDLSMGPFPLGAQGFPMGGGGPFPPGMGGSNPFGTGMPQQFVGRNGFGGPQDMRFIDPTTGQQVAQRGPFPPVMADRNSFANGMPRQFGGRNGFGGPQDMQFIDPSTGQLVPQSRFRVNQGSNQMHDKDHTGGNTYHLHGSAGVGAHSTGPSAGITGETNAITSGSLLGAVQPEPVVSLIIDVPAAGGEGSVNRVVSNANVSSLGNPFLARNENQTLRPEMQGQVSFIRRDGFGHFYEFYPRPGSGPIRVNITKGGFCRRGRTPERNHCVQVCYSDHQCPRDLKCCPSGCSLGCMNPSNAVVEMPPTQLALLQAPPRRIQALDIHRSPPVQGIASTCNLTPCQTHIDCAGDTFCSRGKTTSCQNQLVCQPP